MSESMENRLLPQLFEFSQTSTSVSIIRWKHGEHVSISFRKFSDKAIKTTCLYFDHQNVQTFFACGIITSTACQCYDCVFID